MEIKIVWDEMDKIMASYVPKIRKLKEKYPGNENKNIIKLEKIITKSNLYSLFYKPEVYSYYMKSAMKALDINFEDMFIERLDGLIIEESSDGQEMSKILIPSNEISDAIDKKYCEVILSSIKNFDGRGSFSKYFFNNFITWRIRDKDILKIFEKRKITESLEFIKSNNSDGNEIKLGDTIKSENFITPEKALNIKYIIDTEAIVLLFMKNALIIREQKKPERTFEKIFEKMYTSDFCNLICKNSKEIDYISEELLKHQRELFDFMDLSFMDFFMIDESRTIESVSKNETKTEKQIGIRPNRDINLQLPIQQRVYKFYYETKMGIDIDSLNNIKHRFETYKKIILKCIPKEYKKAYSEEEMSFIENFVNRYVKRN